MYKLQSCLIRFLHCYSIRFDWYQSAR
jgi:hypothetical protein